VVEKELTASLKQVPQAGFPFGALEDVILLDLGHRQPSALGGKSIARPRGRLLLDEQLVEGLLPLGLRHDFRKSFIGRFHSALSFVVGRAGQSLARRIQHSSLMYSARTE
jgi:hypothetical protein